MHNKKQSGLHTKVSVNFYLAPPVIVVAFFAALNATDHGLSFPYLLFALSVSALLLIAVYASRYRERLLVPAAPPFLMFYGFMVWALCSLIGSPVFASSLFTVLTFASCPLAMLLAYASHKDQQILAQGGLLGVGLVMIGLSLYQHYALGMARPVGFLANWNSNAAVLVMLLLPVCAGFLNRARAGRIPWISGLLLVLFAFVLSLTLSRGAFGALLAGLAILLAYAWKTGYPRRFMVLLCALLAAGYALPEAISAGQQAATAPTRISTAKNARKIPKRPVFRQYFQQHTLSGNLNRFSQGRNILWSIGWRMYLEKPWTGWGAGMYFWLFPQYRPPVAGAAGQFFIHNDYLQFLLELGPAGALLMLGFAACVAGRVGRHCTMPVQDAAQGLSDLSLLAACLAILAHSLVTFNLYQASILMLLGLYLGSYYQRQKEPVCACGFQPKTGLRPSIYYGSCLFMALIILFFSLVAARGFQAVRQYEKARDSVTALNYLRDAERSLPFMDEYPSRQAMLILGLFKGDNRPQGQDRQYLLDYGLQKINRALALNPWRSVNHAHKAALTALLTPEQMNCQAAGLYAKALHLKPHDLQTRTDYARYLLKFGQRQRAKTVLLGGLGKYYFIAGAPALDFLQTLRPLLDEKTDGRALLKKINDRIWLVRNYFKRGRASLYL